MPRVRKHFKIRPPKVYHHLKFQTSGTYTGNYKGLPISKRRIEFASKQRYRKDLPYLDLIVGTPLAKSPALGFRTVNPKDQSCVYLFSHVRTRQVLYSLTPYLDPEHAMPQLTFYGKKTVPEKIRKDDWRPYAVAQFTSNAVAMIAYTKLRELRMLRDYAWRDPNAKILPEKKQRQRELMNHVPKSVADLSTVITKLNGLIGEGAVQSTAEWKAVEDMAAEGFSGGIKNMKKMISRAQKAFTHKAKGKYRRMSLREKKYLKIKMKRWISHQTLMYKAQAAVLKVQRAARQGAWERANGINQEISQTENLTAEASEPALVEEVQTGSPEQSSITAREPQAIESSPTSELISAKQDGKFQSAAKDSSSTFGAEIEQAEGVKLTEEQHPYLSGQDETFAEGAQKTTDYWDSFEFRVFKRLYKVDLKTPLPELANQMAERAYTQALNGSSSASNSTDDDFKAEHPVHLFWSEIADRKYTNGWPGNTTHMSMGPRLGADQYVAHTPQWYKENSEAWNSDIFEGDEAINDDIKIQSELKKEKEDRERQEKENKTTLSEAEQKEASEAARIEQEQIAEMRRRMDEHFATYMKNSRTGRRTQALPVLGGKPNAKLPVEA